MDFRQANMSDLSSLKEMYQQIVANMNEQNIQIWDNIYPCEFLEEDIKNNQLYVLIDNDEIVSAFALSDTSSGENAVKWSENQAKVLYLDRLGVNIKYLKKGIGSLMIDKAKEIANTLEAKYLRLFVVDINIPAIQLYIKNGFVIVDGIYHETFDDGFVLSEYGYEIKLA